MSDPFQITKSLGLMVFHGQISFHGGMGGMNYWVSAADLERLLASGVKVECRQLPESGLTDQHGPGWLANEPSVSEGRVKRIDQTHTALLINIQPIVRDSPEQLVKDLASHGKFPDAGHPLTLKTDYWIERARRLVGK